MNKRKLTAMMSTLALTLTLLCGCIRSGVDVVINENDTGTVSVSMGINEKYYNSMMAEEGAEDVLDGKVTTKVNGGEDTYIIWTPHQRNAG